MALYLIDSNVLIDYLNGRQKIVELLERLTRGQDRLHISTISVTEVIAGTKPEDIPTVMRFLLKFHIETPTATIAEKAGRYLYNFARKGITLTLADTTIAATAASQQLILITHNHKHFPMEDISLYPNSQII